MATVEEIKELLEKQEEKILSRLLTELSVEPQHMNTRISTLEAHNDHTATRCQKKINT